MIASVSIEMHAGTAREGAASAEDTIAQSDSSSWPPPPDAARLTRKYTLEPGRLEIRALTAEAMLEGLLALAMVMQNDLSRFRSVVEPTVAPEADMGKTAWPSIPAALRVSEQVAVHHLRTRNAVLHIES